MEDAEKCVGELPFVVSGRDPAVARPDAGAEWMGRHIQAAALEVEADRRGHRLSEHLLAVARIRAIEDRRAGGRLGLATASLGNRRHQRNQLSP